MKIPIIPPARAALLLAFSEGGGCVVEVSGADAMIEWLRFPTMHNQEAGPWLGAAIREAWLQGINAGGSVLGGQVTPDAPMWVQQLERNRLYSNEEIERVAKPN
jgi:hypothetical protein